MLGRVGRDRIARNDGGAPVELGPGDALFIPVGWWHALDAIEPSITLSFVEFGVPNKYDNR